MTDTQSSAPPVATDLQDERLRTRSGVRGAIANGIDRVRSGDLGSLPVIIGLLVIWTIFQILNPFFLSPGNLVNLAMESAAIGIIALGIVGVLLVGEIDLSVGSVSGLAAAIVGVTFVNQRWPLILAMLAAVAAGALIGWLYGQIHNRFGVPTFVITLAGLLGFLGLQLFVLGPTGTINIPFDSGLVWFGQKAFVSEPLSYALVVLAVAGYAAMALATARRRTRAGLSAQSRTSIFVKTAALAVPLLFVTWYLNQARGIGWMFVLFIALVLIMNYAYTRTAWGRSVFAVGGNAEAARRSGIRVKSVYTSVFILCSSLAAFGGLMAAGRLAASSQSSGAGDVNLNAIAAAVIGGTSLFGGRGSAFAALLGIIVIQSISSGLTLMNLDSSFRYMVTGAVLLLAVILDAVSRRSRSSHGKA
ncbi:sugar ABC transporter permease [Mycetocola spongiae]|uniref:sugar ABC transporter permease n=1 Tax=Mycetocola spongiae TaxID=2859226 RepID=UPI001CF55AA4|nr:sugar ABC transporter permease [Mycetocola spongiae]UCR88865.1 sugar ABC transporter permease [Mycetocola spongiae]